MEDGFPLFDPNDDAERQEQRLREYYEEFSANARQRLLAKTIVRPTTVYDVLYPSTRETLLSKNTPFNTDLEEDAKIIRDRLIAKIITNETDLEKISSNFRNSLLARAKIQDDRAKLMEDGDLFRKQMISKNVPSSNNIEKDSGLIRTSNVSKNKPNPSAEDSIEKNSPTFRGMNISKNVPKKQDLLIDSEQARNQFRKNDINKNVPNNSDIEKNSEEFRRNNLSKNSNSKITDIEENSVIKRQSELAKNFSKNSNLEDSSELFRKGDVSKNVPKEQDLLIDSEEIRNQFRKNDLNKNVPNNSDIERDNDFFRRNNLSKNIPGKNDFDGDSEIYRNANISKDAKNIPINIDEISEQKRMDSLSKNNPNTSDLEQGSIEYRKDDLSKNTTNNSNLEKDSELFRKDDLSLNKPKITDLESESNQYRIDDLSLNKPKFTNLETDSVPFRDSDLSVNKSNETNLEVDSIQYRVDDLSANKPKITDLEKDSVLFRQDDLSLNKPKFTNLETDSVPFRDSDLSFNKPKFTNLEIDSVPFRDSDLSFNKPKFTNLEIDSIDYRNEDLSRNTPNTSNLEIDSIPFREDDLSANVPNISDLATDSTPFLYNNLSSNVPNTSDLEIDSIPFREDDLSANLPSNFNLFNYSEDFRDDNLSSNVPITSNLLIDSAPFRASDLAANVPVNSNIASDSVDFREDALSKNTPFNTDLLSDSSSFRNDLMAKNAGFGLLGVNVQGAGTNAFLGISRVFTQGILIRQLLFSKNHSKNTNLLLDSEAFRDNNKFPNKWQVTNNEYTSSSENYKLAPLMQGEVDNDQYNQYGSIFSIVGGSPISYGVFSTDAYRKNFSRNLQQIYGTSVGDEFPSGRVDIRLNTAYYSTDTISPNGGAFTNSSYNLDSYISYGSGYLTYTIKNYNLERNAFNLNQLQPGNPDTLSTLQEYDIPGFQDLISKTIGSFSGKFQARTLTTPSDVISKNGGSYYKGGNIDTDLLRPDAVNAELGSAESMMAKTTVGNPFQDEDFFRGRRGVRHIVNTIKNSDNPLAANFDPQNNKVYIVGKNEDGSNKVSRQKFTIANPYAPGKAQKLIFSIKNYSNNQRFHFPPYIKSISNTENASWNATNFLGRPEAVYTYNNSSRDASISFYVLTDYAQKVDIGTDWNSDGLETLGISSDEKRFTESDITENENDNLELGNLQKERDDKVKELADLEAKIQENSPPSVVVPTNQPVIEATVSNTGQTMTEQMNAQVTEVKEQEKNQQNQGSADKSEVSALLEQKARLLSEIGKIDETIEQKRLDFDKKVEYHVTNNVTTNVYDFNTSLVDRETGEISSKPGNTLERINDMKKNLMFQPAFFSGDKVDFVRKMEFLSKLTRPSANNDGSNTGFSFINPPVCHIHLGDWWHHDIIVNSVSFDYADAPWTLDGGSVQPMWALVTISFNIIGSFGGTSRPPLSTDKGGMYSHRS